MNGNNSTIFVTQGTDGAYQALPGARFYLKSGTPDQSDRQGRTPYPDTFNTSRWSYWGSDDRFPSTVRLALEKVPMAGQAIWRRMQTLYGNGIAYYRRADLYDADGVTVPRASIRKVDDFLTRNRVSTAWYQPQCLDFATLVNSFSEMIFSRDKSTITGIYHKTAEHCRLSIQDPDSLRNEYLLFSRKFGDYSPIDSDISRIALYDYTDEERFLERLVGYKVGWHTYADTPGSIVYCRPPWLGLFRESGWLDVSCAVPEIVTSMMRNQIMLKYQINVPESYFQMTHPDWDTYTAEQRDKAFDDLVAKINDSLTGTKNAFQSIAFVFRQDPISGKEMGKVEILAVDDKTKNDHWVPSSEKADAQIVQGLGIHPSQLGLAPEGGKMGAGSGSDQRESYNTAITINTPEQHLLLEPLNWLARYNAREDPDWDVVFFIDHTHHTTTNQKEDGLAPSSTTLTIE